MECPVCKQYKESTCWRACGFEIEINDADPEIETELICDDCEQGHLWEI